MVISVLIGILMIFSGVFHIVAAIDAPEHHRAWRAIAGVLFIVGGIVLIRHLQYSLALIGLIVGFSWIIQGVSSLIGGITRRGGRGGWSIFFGIVSLLAGIVVVSVPVTSVVFLTTFLGIWFAVIGVFEMIDAWMSRHIWDGPAAGPVSVPGQRAESETPDSRGWGHRGRAHRGWPPLELAASWPSPTDLAAVQPGGARMLAQAVAPWYMP